MIELYLFLSKFKKDVVCAEVIFNLKIPKKILYFYKIYQIKSKSQEMLRSYLKLKSNKK